MSPMASLRNFGAILRLDRELARVGPRYGWLTAQYCRARAASRFGYAAGPTRVRVSVDGVPVRLTLTAAHYPVVIGIFLAHEYDLRKLLPRPPATVLDLGANAGMAAAYLNAIFPGGRYVCVEPDPRNVRLLKANIAANRLPAAVVEAAVGSRPGELDLKVGPDPTMTAPVDSPISPGPNSRVIRVPMLTVPQICERHGLDRIDLLKLDIEGAEADVLCRDNGWLERVGAIVLELHENMTPEQVRRALSPYGFRLTRTACPAAPIYLAVR